ncbi:Ig-like domain-containing protein, partial [Limnohabitans sp. Rim47]
IDNPEVGIYTIEIRGYNVPQGPQPFALFASGDFGTDSSDTISPTVNITAPSNGATVSGTVAYSADASDNVGVTQVKFFIDGVLVGTDTTAPYSISWDTTNYSNGDHNLVAKAYDAAGNV